jgi:glutathione S-transferase
VALGYLDFRYAGLKWREAAPRLAGAYAALAERPSFVSTQPYDENARS